MNHYESDNNYQKIINALTDIISELSEDLKRFKGNEETSDCEKKEPKKEVLKDFSECTVGEKFLINMLENGSIDSTDQSTIIEQAEDLLVNDNVVQFMFVYSEEFRNVLNELLNSLYLVDLSKLRIKRS